MYLFFNIYKGDIQPFNIHIRLQGKDIRKDHSNGSKDGEILQRMFKKPRCGRSHVFQVYKNIIVILQ